MRAMTRGWSGVEKTMINEANKLQKPDSRKQGGAGGYSMNGTRFGSAVRWAVVAAGSMLWMASAAAKTGGPEEAVVVPPGSADAAAPFVSEDSSPTSRLSLLVNKGISLTTKTPFKRVYVGSPDIADANALGQNRLLVTGKKPGTTQVIVWDDNEKAQVLDVSVQIDIAGLKDQLKT